MSDYSIELSAERIVDARTKRYFAEVHGCYNAGHFRSAVVMLWSVVVTDILFKLDQLANAYGDATAKAILTEIGDARKNNPKSPEWEAELVNKVASRTDLLDPAELSFLQSLQAHRHLSAHPVMTGGEALFSPNQELHLPPEQLAADILKKEQRIAETMENIRNLLAKHGK